MQRSVSAAKAVPTSTFLSPPRRRQRSKSLERSPTSDDGSMVVSVVSAARRRALPVEVFAVIAPPPVPHKHRSLLSGKSNGTVGGRASSRAKDKSVQNSASSPSTPRDTSVFVDIKEVQSLLFVVFANYLLRLP
jgi:hypothetical protein